VISTRIQNKDIAQMQTTFDSSRQARLTAGALVTVAGVLLPAGAVIAETPAAPSPLTLSLDATEASTAPATAPAGPALPRLAPYVDYTGDLLSRRTLTGDWGGSRQELMKKGVRFDASLTQVFQRNVAGARSQACTYRGKLDLTLQLDTTYMDLWPGGLFKIKAEGGWGQGNNRRTGALMPVDTNGLYPEPGKDAFSLAEVNYTQFLAPFVGVTVGKYAPRDANIFTHDETEQFLNAALNFNPIIGTTVPIDFLGAGVIVIPAEGVISTTMILDTEGTASEHGFDTVFKGGTSVLQTLEVAVKPFELPGHQRVGFYWTDKVRTQLDQSPRDIIGAILPGGPVTGLRKSSGDYALSYDFDQYIYIIPGSKDRGIGVFGKYGYSDGNVNPIANFYAVGLSGKGLIPSRENDTCGIGYYFLDMSRDIPAAIDRRIRNEQGVELYYNIAITPWCKLTPDIQVISPAREDVSTTVVVGMRLKIDF
jgi:porin